jgi:hypothetical protein
MREYDTLLAITLFLIFALLGYHFGQTQLDASRSLAASSLTKIELSAQ